MKKTIALAVFLLAFCGTTLAEIFWIFDYPKDNPVARGYVQIWYRVELKSEQAAYWSLIETRIFPLKYGDITNSVGQKLDKLPDDKVVPFFISGVGISGLHPVENDKSHIDVYAIGDIGYLQVFYYWDGDSINTAVIYLRADDKFVPLQSTGDFAKRLDWDKAKFQLAKQWLVQHLPKLTDLGVVTVSSDTPVRVALGNGKTCIITTTQPEKNNDLFSMVLTLDTTNTTENDQSRIYETVSQPGQSISFKMAGNFYRLTPKLQKP